MTGETVTYTYDSLKMLVAAVSTVTSTQAADGHQRGGDVWSRLVDDLAGSGVQLGQDVRRGI